MKKGLVIILTILAAVASWGEASFAGGLGRDATHGMRRIGPRTPPALQANPNEQLPSTAATKKKRSRPQ
jgi:hypothetical protein